MKDDWLIDSLAACGLELEIIDSAAVDDLVDLLRPNARPPRTESRGGISSVHLTNQNRPAPSSTKEKISEHHNTAASA